MKEIDLREAIACVKHLREGHNNSRKYEIGIVAEKIPVLSYIEVGAIVVFYELQSGNGLVVAKPDMSSVLHTQNTIVGVPSKFITKIILE